MNRPVVFAVETILRSWLADTDLTIFCGNWNHGGVMELLPRGRARLTDAKYGAPFEGLRDLHLEDSPHHVHLDLGRLTKAWYVVTPSVCYGFRPSFELRLTVEAGDPLVDFGLGLALSHPYVDGQLRPDIVKRYLRRAAEHAHQFPAVASCVCASQLSTPAVRTDWSVLDDLLSNLGNEHPDGALSVREALQGRKMIAHQST
ncbi:hypothetical protein [Variovorax sp. J31P207]|uniref:hypothetical protein n=1 Tax=Variovorax sp. J31P207 TaxID=3053510 RepID=UPI0025752567|nr:hypothetical protein [Variovorax sp. J31P207]MDM0071543.1 hypothetical protein [Variovorax sp. J31P207]